MFMSELSENAARRAALLRRVQELSLAIAEDLADAVVATADAEQKAKLASAFHRIARGLRQSIALEAKLEREQAEEGAAAQRARTAALPRIIRRKLRLGAEIERLVWTEYDHADAEEAEHAHALIARAEAWLEAASETDGFLDEPAEALIARLCAHLGVALETLTPALQPNGPGPAWPDSG